MSKKLTPWFPGSVAPDRRGVYQTLIPFPGRVLERYQFWDGYCWGCFADSIRGAFGNQSDPSEWQDVRWRGLAKKP